VLVAGVLVWNSLRLKRDKQIFAARLLDFLQENEAKPNFGDTIYFSSFLNMQELKGLHNRIDNGFVAGINSTLSRLCRTVWNRNFTWNCTSPPQCDGTAVSDR
jgi:hypothetical protein